MNEPTAICPGCGRAIDPEVCHCGEEIKHHNAEHSPVPAGCTCGYADAENRKAPSHQKIIILKGGIKITPEEAIKALDAAMTIIEKAGTVGSESGQYYRDANAWMEKYYPAWA